MASGNNGNGGGSGNLGGNGGDGGAHPRVEIQTLGQPETATMTEATVVAVVGGSGSGEDAVIEAAAVEKTGGIDPREPNPEGRAPVVEEARGTGEDAVIEAAVEETGGIDLRAPNTEGRALVGEEAGGVGGGSRAEVAVEGADPRAPGLERRAPVVVGAVTLGGPGPFEVHGDPTGGDDDGGMEAILEEIERDPSRGK